ncbi:MAG: hypothetical protein DRO15_07905 [Thermoprotei archaeon]|nr:MAG: hypothetical protein DRO15_07905 [Thermoprotei archaeon]
MKKSRVKKRKKVVKGEVVKESLKDWVIKSVKGEFSGSLGKFKLALFLLILALYIALLMILYKLWI